MNQRITFSFSTSYITISNYWIRLSGISRIVEAEVGVVSRSPRLLQTALTEASIVLDILQKLNSIITLLFIWTITKIVIY
mgnify:CR=1 FL=1